MILRLPWIKLIAFLKRSIKKLSSYGFVSMIGTVASTGTGYLSVIVTGIYLNHSDAGIYTAVLSIVSVLMFFQNYLSGFLTRIL